MSNQPPLLPLRRRRADVLSFADARAARYAAAATPEAQARYAPLTEAAQAAARRTTSQQPPLMPYVELDISNNDLIFQAMNAGLMRAQRAKHITDFGATLSNTELQGDGGYWERPATLSFGEIIYTVTLLSNCTPENIGAPDTDFPKRSRDECIMLMESDGGTKFFVYADRIKGAPQINNPRYWKVLASLGQGDVVSWSFRQFLHQHHPKNLVMGQVVMPTAADTELRGYSVGSHKRASIKGGHVMIVGGTDRGDGKARDGAGKAKRKPRNKAARKGPAKINKGPAKIKKTVAKKAARGAASKSVGPKSVGRTNTRPRRSTPIRSRRQKRPEDSM